MNERRYSEEETAEIFRRAAEAQQEGTLVPLASREGMTLGALQEIGREVGLPPELIAHAARALERGGRSFTRRFAGLPIGVGRTVELDRKLTDSEWQRLVVDLRETFDARGALRQDGAFRQWSNGNLQALLEPIGDAERLRLRTTNGAARGWMTAGLAMIGASLVPLLMLAGDASAGAAWAGAAPLAGLGVGAFGFGALRLPAWSRLRRRQMEEIAARVAASIEGPGDSNRISKG
ncbi:MAG TPA: hypothetical protein VFZ56_13540 [Gemmatimonadaceae bacterium]